MSLSLLASSSLRNVFGLLSVIFSLRERVSLVRDEIRGYSIELRNERGEIDVWRIVSLGP